jgi:hypothetical protein
MSREHVRDETFLMVIRNWITEPRATVVLEAEAVRSSSLSVHAPVRLGPGSSNAEELGVADDRVGDGVGLGVADGGSLGPFVAVVVGVGLEGGEAPGSADGPEQA